MSLKLYFILPKPTKSAVYATVWSNVLQAQTSALRKEEILGPIRWSGRLHLTTSQEAKVAILKK